MNRPLWPDVIRICAICGVAVVHSMQLPQPPLIGHSFSAIAAWFVFLIAKTCVPLFLMISGALLLGKTEPSKTFFLKRVRRILVPWVFWTTVFLVTKYHFAMTSVGSSVTTFVQIFSAEFSFLPALCVLYLLMPYFRIFVAHASTRQQWALIFLWFLCISLLPYTRNSMAFPAVVDNGLVRQAIHYSGYLFLGFGLQKVLLSHKKLQSWLVGVFMMFFVTNYISVALQFFYEQNASLFLSYVSPLIVISATLTFCLLYWLGTWIQTIVNAGRCKILRPLVQELSAASFGVFFVHSLILSAIHGAVSNNPFVPLINQSGIIVVETIIISFGIILLLRRVPMIRKVVS